MTLSVVLAVFVGAILGLTGAGGGILAVPALVYGQHLPMQQAAPVALIAVAVSAAIGAIEGFRKGLVRYKAAALMALSGVPVTYVGQMVAAQLPQAVLLLCFSAVMILVAVRLLLQARGHSAQQGVDEHAPGKINPESGKFIWNLSTFLTLSGTGALTGFMTGLLGVGGGFVIVPMLRKWTQVSMHGIVATSLMVIALVGSGGVATALLHGIHIDPVPTMAFTFATMIGMIFGRMFIQRISPRLIQMGFAGVLLLVSASFMFTAISTF